MIAHLCLQPRFFHIENQLFGFLYWHMAVNTICRHLRADPGKHTAFLLLMAAQALYRIGGGRSLWRMDIVTCGAGEVRRSEETAAAFEKQRLVSMHIGYVLIDRTRQQEFGGKIISRPEREGRSE